jgi:sn-glycerol 3-phosphate transport system permease protein
LRKKVIFNGIALPYLLLLPQLVITAVFFFWPAGQAIYGSFLREDAFGLSREFVGLENFHDILRDPNYLHAMWNTAVFSTSVAVLSLGAALLLAVQADKAIRGANAYKTLLIWPYEVNGDQAMTLVILAAAWKQVSYNFIFFLAGLQSIPKAVLEAAAIDGARPMRRFWTVIFPLLAPTGFFLLVVNIVYAFFDTFGIIHALTQGGPGKATETLIYKVYVDGVQNLNFGASAAQSVVLMAIVILLTAVQFRFIERKVHY